MPHDQLALMMGRGTPRPPTAFPSLPPCPHRLPQLCPLPPTTRPPSVASHLTWRMGWRRAAAPVFTGTKYSVRQQRGRFGIGAKMALICAKVTADEALDVTTSQPGSNFISKCRLDIDVVKNQPNVLVLEKRPQTSPPFQGTIVSVVIEGEWNRGRGVRGRQATGLQRRRIACADPLCRAAFPHPGQHCALHSALGADHAVRAL